MSYRAEASPQSAADFPRARPSADRAKRPSGLRARKHLDNSARKQGDASGFDGETFASLDDANTHAEHWCRDIAGARIDGTTHQVPREVFESVEKAAMLSPPTAPFDVPRWYDDVKVQPDHHIQVASALYSVPTLYLRKEVKARVDKTLVKIYLGTDCIKVHPRQPPGSRSTDVNDYLPSA